jgi:hypothetical protein
MKEIGRLAKHRIESMRIETVRPQRGYELALPASNVTDGRPIRA